MSTLEKARLLRGLLSREKAHTFPLYVSVSLTRRCNFRCRYCKFHSPLSDFPARLDPGFDLPLELLEDLFRQIAGQTRDVVFAGEGEPLLYPKLEQAVAAAKTRGLRVNLVTNGLALTDERIQALIDLELDQLTVSVWANSPEQFEILHPGFDRESARDQLDRIDQVARLKKSSQSTKPILCLHQPIVRENHTSIETAARHALDLGCDRLTYAPSHAWKEQPAEHLLIPEEQDRLMSSLTRIKESVQSRGLDHNIDTVIDLYSIGERVWEHSPCYTGWFYSVIRVDGTVSPCGRSDLTLGDLNQSSFLDIWNGTPYRRFRKAASTPAGLEALRTNCVCGYCTHLRNTTRIHNVFRHVDHLSFVSRETRERTSIEAARSLQGSETHMNEDTPLANLRTGENRKYDCEPELSELDLDSLGEQAVTSLIADTNRHVLDLLDVPDPEGWSVRHTISGTDNIQTMVHTFCTSAEEKNFLLHTDKYALTAQAAMKKGNGGSFSIIKFSPGRALTRESAEFEQLRGLIRTNADAIYLVWNSTSTGALVDPGTVEELVSYRDQVGSQTVIIVDGATYIFFSERWREFRHYPDVFAFSNRKDCCLPYSKREHTGGIVVYNGRALQRARENGQADRVERQPLDENHLVNIGKLSILVNRMLNNGRQALRDADEMRTKSHETLMQAFSADGDLGSLGYRLVADSSVQSWISYAVKVPVRISTQHLLENLEQRGVRVSTGSHPEMKRNIIRLSVYSANTIEEVTALVSTMREVSLRMLNWKTIWWNRVRSVFDLGKRAVAKVRGMIGS